MYRPEALLTRSMGRRPPMGLPPVWLTLNQTRGSPFLFASPKKALVPLFLSCPVLLSGGYRARKAASSPLWSPSIVRG